MQKQTFHTLCDSIVGHCQLCLHKNVELAVIKFVLLWDSEILTCIHLRTHFLGVGGETLHICSWSTIILFHQHHPETIETLNITRDVVYWINSNIAKWMNCCTGSNIVKTLFIYRLFGQEESQLNIAMRPNMADFPSYEFVKKHDSRLCMEEIWCRRPEAVQKFLSQWTHRMYSFLPGRKQIEHP